MLPSTAPGGGLYSALRDHGISRRTFLKFCGGIAGVLALPAAFGPRIAAALEAAPPLHVVWLHGQACGGDTAAFLRSSSPTTSELLLRLLSVDYQEMLMSSAGDAATSTRAGPSDGSGYLAVIEGSIPKGASGMYCMVGGRPIIDVAREVTRGALATIAVGSCAVDGGAPGARNGVSNAVGIGDLRPGSPLINLPGCPVNVENLVATIVHYVTFKELPPLGSGRLPLFAYGGLIHNQCERRAHYEFGEFATEWGDAGAQQGWCLYKLGCKGPEAFGNCPTERFAEGTSWCIAAGHGCIGCTMPSFWDTMQPAYRRLPSPLPFAPTASVDLVGGGLVGGVAALTGVHAAGSYVRAGLARRQASAPSPETEGRGGEEKMAPETTGLDVGASDTVDSDLASPLPPTGETGGEVPPTDLPEAPPGDELSRPDAVETAPPAPVEGDTAAPVPEPPSSVDIAETREDEHAEWPVAPNGAADDERIES